MFVSNKGDRKWTDRQTDTRTSRQTDARTERELTLTWNDWRVHWTWR